MYGPSGFTSSLPLCPEASDRAAPMPLSSDEAISTLVSRIIDSQIADGLFKDSPISFRDVEIIKRTFTERLRTIYHTRIAYPELKKKEE